jgi:hypothetical protein
VIDSVKFILGPGYELRKSIIQMIVLIICGGVGEELMGVKQLFLARR